jgi:phosphoribosylaminoimidazolecarboxamide formyltransferase/IMP cyclohydrolase
MELKYGCNPHQAAASVVPLDVGTTPVKVRNGRPSMINFLDALNAWQLVAEVRAALDLPAAASFKHVSPAGAAVAVDLTDDLRQVYEVQDDELTPAATAYVRARGADPKSSFGDFVALSDEVDVPTARFLKRCISDGIIAPGFEPEAYEILAAKKKGNFVVMEADPDFVPPARESREMFGMRLVQDSNRHASSLADLASVQCGELTDAARRDLVLGLVAIKYTQSNSVGYALDGQMIGIGAGQQSRVDCTKLAGAKADTWHLGRHPKVLGLRFKDEVKRQQRINWRVRYIEGDLTKEEEAAFHSALDGVPEPLAADEKRDWIATLDGVSMISDGFIPFRDNIDHCSRHGVRFVAQPGNSIRDAEVTAACREYGITMVHTGVRLFHH